MKFAMMNDANMVFSKKRTIFLLILFFVFYGCVGKTVDKNELVDSRVTNLLPKEIAKQYIDNETTFIITDNYQIQVQYTCEPMIEARQQNGPINIQKDVSAKTYTRNYAFDIDQLTFLVKAYKDTYTFSIIFPGFSYKYTDYSYKSNNRHAICELPFLSLDKECDLEKAKMIYTAFESLKGK